MAALDFLTERGITARRNGMRVRVGPRDRITDEITKYVRRHRLRLLAELTAGDGLERRVGWTVVAPGYLPFTMISEPITKEEALETVRVRWPGASVE